MRKRSGRQTDPLVFIGDRNVRGRDDRAELDREGRPDPMPGLGTRT